MGDRKHRLRWVGLRSLLRLFIEVIKAPLKPPHKSQIDSEKSLKKCR